MQAMRQTSLKPQDVVILTKLCGYPTSKPPTYSVIASEIEISTAEVAGGIKRLRSAQLVQPNDGASPILDATKEFLVHGIKYMFPPVFGTMRRGIATSYAAPPLSDLIVLNKDKGNIPVWPYPQGTSRGFALTPLYPTVPIACLRDQSLYQKLALIDAIRSGSTRERELAIKLLVERLDNAPV
ncbi:MAG: hypothetical protein UZ17_ACD001000459 [Acidobacteria bacterium OLB17]|nr:MAG: hypothetical protein UZ17_ACD001000459 [Acidobacteria bacterium OLB17]MCZ2391133.1 hypothetical protein [Acidobacteriota bacterium]